MTSFIDWAVPVKQFQIWLVLVHVSLMSLSCICLSACLLLCVFASHPSLCPVWQRKEGIWDDEALQLTQQLLSSNPDFATLWNYRREILMHLETVKLDDYQLSRHL